MTDSKKLEHKKLAEMDSDCFMIITYYRDDFEFIFADLHSLVQGSCSCIEN